MMGIAGGALLRKSFADVTRRKGRTLLVILGIMVGVFGLTSINVAAGALYGAFAYSASKSSQPDLEIDVRSVDATTLQTLRDMPNVTLLQADTYYFTRWQVAAAPGHVNMQIVAHEDNGNIRLNPFQLTAGHLPGHAEIVMESSDKGLQRFAIGDWVTVNGAHGAEQLHVVGLARTLGLASASFANTARAYMQEGALQQLMGEGGPNVLRVLVQDKTQKRATLNSLLDTLRERNVAVSGSSILDNEFDPSSLNGVFAIMRALSLVALVLTSFLIINTVTTLVTEQTAIIGTMKAIGATRGRVMRAFMLSVGIYAAIGTALGITLGIWGGYQFTAFLANTIILDIGPFSVDPKIVLVSIVIGLGVPFAAALLPLWNGTRITVRDALAGYGVTVGNGKVSRNGLARRITWLPQTAWLGLHGVFRRRGRAVLTLLALTLSGAAFLSIQTTTYSVDRFISQIFGQYDADAFVSINSPLPYATLRQKLLAVPDVAYVERFEQRAVKLHGDTLLLTGVEPDAQLYHHTLVAGRWFDGNEMNVAVISDNLADHTGLKVGDLLTFSGSTQTASWRIIGEIHDSNGGLGVAGSAFATINSLHSFEGIPANVGSNFMVQASDRSPAAVDQMATALDDTLSNDGLAPVVSTAQQQIQRNHNQFQILYALLYAVVAIVGLVGILGLFNTLTTSVLERRREIGILRAMGASGWRVASVFWVEGLTLSSIAWLVAVIMGIPAAYSFVGLINEVLLPLPFAFSPAVFATTLVVILVIATLASIIPAMSAARMRIASTLRYE